MEQVETEDKFCGQSSQQLPIKALLQDADAFENVFFPSTYMDFNPAELNEIIDFDELRAILDDGKNSEETHSVVRNESGGGGGGGGGGGRSVSHGSNTMVAAGHVNNGEVLRNAKTKSNNEKQVIKKWNTRKKIQKGTPEAYEKNELRKIKNREAAARAYQENKAHLKWLELEVQKYRKKNADLKRLIRFAESSISLDMSRKQLRRTSSGLL
ncbi:hypothetical protein HRI_000614500 [Hibiscus trionum]|uniref:BZIP domain-containing protein n=1 Tax=Hibiscus trionum TaxID=183268 RepID=A0A9W7LLY7_HIBTR|nr:hypothetical protein HRI_000614500 [Hibiscus trionum]